MAAKVQKLCSFITKCCFIFFFAKLHFKLVTGKNFNHNIRHRYGTKTMYNESFSPDELQIRDEFHSIIPNECKVVIVDVMLRHGIRNPGKKDIIAVNEYHEKLLKSDNELIPESVLRWRNPFEVHEEKLIAESGKIEQESIARRFAKKFFNQLKDAEENNILFFTTDTNRTVESCNAFQRALQVVDNQILFSQPHNCVIENKKLRFFDHCKKYDYWRKKKYLSMEYNDFKKSDIFEDALERIETLYGLEDDTGLSPAIMKALYVVGATERAVKGETPLLQLFKDEDLDLLQYLTDLRSYWKRSYGHDLCYEMSCILLKDVFDQISSAITNINNSPKFVFRFTHAETILPIIALLGLYKDEKPLTAETYHQNKDRQFTTTKLSPFSANVAFIIFQCDDNSSTGSGEDDNYDGYMMKVLVNEIPVVLPFCDSDVCALSSVRQNLGKYIDQCDFEAMCSLAHDEL